MERKLVNMLNKIEVPIEISSKVEEMMREELKCNIQEEQNAKRNQTETRVTYQLKDHKRRKVKTVVAAAATLVLVVGALATSLILRENKGNIPGNSGKVPVETTINSNESKESDIIKQLKNGKLYQLREGDNTIDLDGDGIDEVITIENSMRDTYFSDYKITIGEQTLSGTVDREDGIKVFLAMLTEEKTTVQLTFTYVYGSDDFISNIYNYEDNSLKLVGKFFEDVEKMTVNKDGSFVVSEAGGFLGKWMEKRYQMTGNDNKSSEVAEGKYMLQGEWLYEQEMSFEYEVTALEDITIYTKMNHEDGEIFTIKKGEVVKTVKGYQGKWISIENTNGKVGYLEVRGDDFITFEGNLIPGYELFEGLPYAG